MDDMFAVIGTERIEPKVDMPNFSESDSDY
jgi:hypothetical protein